MIRLHLGMALLTLAPAFAQAPKPVIVNAVVDRYRPLLFDQQKFTGLFANRLRANSEGYLEHLIADAVTPASPRVNLPGAILAAAANAYEYGHHPRLKTVMDRLAKDMISQAKPAGSLESTEVLAYQLLGLLAYYRVTDDENAFAACKAIGNKLIKFSAEPGADSAPGVQLQSIVSLYRYTGDERYLDFCKSIATAARRSQNSSETLSFEHFAYLVGLADLYRITGDESYFKTVLAGWTAAHRDVSLTGTILSGPDHDRELGDECITAAWMELTLNLLRLTGDAHYGQQLEQTIHNQVLAAQDGRTGKIFSKVLWKGAKNPAPIADRCAAVEAQAVSTIPSAVWGRYGNGIAVMLYTGGRATFQLRRRATLQVYSETTYPESGDILLHIEPSHDVQFPLRLRVPDWANKFVVDIGETHLIGNPDEFLTLNRQWKRGDTVKISIQMAVRIMDGGVSHPGEVAIQRGPQVLAIDKTLNPDLDEVAAARPGSTDPQHLKLTPEVNTVPGNWTADQTYRIAGEYQGTPRPLVLAPFADLLTYRVWLPAPGGSSDASDHELGASRLARHQ